MKVFLSWSGKRSYAVATEFRAWLPKIIQDCRDIYISSQTTKGDAWFSTITAALESADIGVLILTPDNQDAPWLNFEGGALLTNFDKRRLIPVLVGFKKTDYVGPMKNLQLTEFDDKEDMRSLLQAINDMTTKPLDKDFLDEEHDLKWQAFADSAQRKLEAVVETDSTTTASTGTVRTADDKIDELLELFRDQQRMMTGLADATRGLLNRENRRVSDEAAPIRANTTRERRLAANRIFANAVAEQTDLPIATKPSDGTPLIVHSLDGTVLGVLLEDDKERDEGRVTYFNSGEVITVDKASVTISPRPLA